MSSNKKTADINKSKVETCCSEPAKRKLLIKIGIGVGVATVLLIVIIAVAVVMSTQSEDEGSTTTQTDTQTQVSNSSDGPAAGGGTVTKATTIAPTTTTEKARLVTIAGGGIDVTLPSSLRGGTQFLAQEEQSKTQWIYYEKDEFVVYIIQEFQQRRQSLVAITKQDTSLENSYNGAILFCEDSELEGDFVTKQQIMEVEPSNGITIADSSRQFDVPSVLLPLRTERCNSLPQVLSFQPTLATGADLMGPTCSSIIGNRSLDSYIAQFTNTDCSAKTSMEDLCGCNQRCLNCTASSSVQPQVPSCQCAAFMLNEADTLACTGTSDDGECARTRDSFKQEVEESPCSCAFGVYFAYACGKECQGNDCRPDWCLSGFTIKSPVLSPSMCTSQGDNIQCT